MKQNTIDGYPQSPSDFTVNDDVLKDLKTTLAEKITCRESLNSSGTVSRKTSTASEYTPEHTVSHDSRPQFIDQTNVSFSTTETCMSVAEQVSKHTIDDTDALRNELNDSLKQKDVKLVPGGKVDLKVFILQQQEPEQLEKISPLVLDTETTTTTKVEDEEKNESQLKVPQRKISRFLVSPVLSKLDVPKEKECNGGDNTEVVVVEEKPPPPPTVSEVGRKNSLAVVETPETSESTSTTSTITSTTSTTEAPVLGPEMINTLEQLKISLDNLKNSSHPTHKKEPSEEIKKSTSAVDVTSTTNTTTAAPPTPQSKPTVTATTQPLLTAAVPPPFVAAIPPPTTSTIYPTAPAAIAIQPVPIIPPPTTTVPVVQPTQTYQQPVASVPPLTQQPAATPPVLPPILIPAPYVAPPVVTTSVVAAAAMVATVAAAKVEEVVKAPPTETKKVLENLRHVCDNR